LARSGARTLSDPSQLLNFVDANNDGMVAPIDALVVLNEIARRIRNPEGESGSGNKSGATAHQGQHAAFDAVYAAWPADSEKKKSGAVWSESESPEESVGLTKPLI